MRAAILEQANQPIKIYDDVEIIEPRVGEVRSMLNTVACAIPTWDLLMARCR
ncbi:hypothetical protein [Oceanicoccus sp. KOV_DT_Chl]|uniref:hypothetical protein n=1 Tax=Oceanicoccus sp. KOV_DT_Chl TaxID=1904639 RepID=UPI00190EBC79|nr:hypothetical protein [Oceanicoccus sp. KOV_DT_Chl]